MPKKSTTCTVQLLDVSLIKVDLDNIRCSDDLLKSVTDRVGVEDVKYFGLQYVHRRNGLVFWLDKHKPFSRELKKAGYSFKFSVQNYPLSAQMLKKEATRYQFVLQIRENLLMGRWSCSTPTQALLASYICQAEYGDYCALIHGNEYLEDVQFMPNQDWDFVEKVSAFHKNHESISAETSDCLYLNTASKISLYGMELFDITDADGNAMLLGVGIYGIHVIHMNTILHTFIWPIVSNIHVHGKHLLVDLRIPTENDHCHLSVGFVCSSAIFAKRISKSAIRSRQFYLSSDTNNQTKTVEKCTHVTSHNDQHHLVVERVASRKYSNHFTNAGDVFMDRDVNHQNNLSVRQRCDTTSSMGSSVMTEYHDEMLGEQEKPTEEKPVETLKQLADTVNSSPGENVANDVEIPLIDVTPPTDNVTGIDIKSTEVAVHLNTEVADDIKVARDDAGDLTEASEKEVDKQPKEDVTSNDDDFDDIVIIETTDIIEE